LPWLRSEIASRVALACFGLCSCRDLVSFHLSDPIGCACVGFAVCCVAALGRPALSLVISRFSVTVLRRIDW